MSRSSPLGPKDKGYVSVSPQQRKSRREPPPREQRYVGPNEDKPMYSVRAPVAGWQDDEVRWVNCGVAFGGAGKDGKSISIILDSLPIAKNWDGRFMLFPVYEKDES